MTDRECVTIELGAVPAGDRPRPCYRRGMLRDGTRIPQAHWAACEDELCRGCVPRSATHGFLCDSCYAKFTDALSRLRDLIPHLRSVDTNGQALGERVHTSMDHSIIVPQSWFAADGLMEALGAHQIPSTMTIDDTIHYVNRVVDDWETDLDKNINTREGAKRAVVLIRRMQTALHRWPNSEATYRHVPFLLCPRCSQKNLFRRAPLEYLDDLLVQCSTEDCGYERSWFEFMDVYRPIIEGIFAEQDRVTRRERREARKASA